MTTTKDPRTVKVGDYLVASWGYDQTNASFFKVTKRTPKMATVIEVEGRYHTDDQDNATLRLEPSDTPKWDHDRDACGIPALDYDSAGNERNDWRDYHEAARICKVPKTHRRIVKGEGTEHVSLKITSYMWARPYEGGGAYDTLAAGEPGH